MTNGERIRTMTDEELGEFFSTLGIECEICIPWRFCDGDCAKAWERWVKKESEK